jgi:murein DD-endopeptidase MepM/ murein hydrolase activator NlpD
MQLSPAIPPLLLLATLAFSQNLAEQRDAHLKEMLYQRNAYIKEMTEQRDAYFKDYLKSQWAYFLKMPGVSLPASPDSLKIKTIGIPKIKQDENPNIEIINALLKEGVNEKQAVNIALQIIDSLGIDAIREGQSIGIAAEKNNAENPVVVSYKIDSLETSTLLQSKTSDYKYVKSGGNSAGKASRCSWANPQYVFPLKNSCRKTSGFGMREHPLLGKPLKHDGVDYAAPRGTEVYAMASGIVVESSYTGINGNYVAIKHANGILSYYLHLNEKGIEKGSHVEAGQMIGKVGSTGRSTGPHLHFAIMKDGTWMDPEKKNITAGLVEHL